MEKPLTAMKLLRRLLFWISLLSTSMMQCFGDAADDAAWEALRAAALNRKRQVLYNTDGCDSVVYPRDKPFSVEGFLDVRLNYAIGSRIDTVLYAPNSSGFYCMTYPTKVGSVVYWDWDNPEWRNITREMFEAGTDALQETERFCRRNGFEFFISLRVNDTHDSGKPLGSPGMLTSEWKKSHPDFLLGTFEKQPPYCAWSAADFTHPETRQHFVDIAQELLERYDVDGIELDFCRHFQLFKSVAWGGKASREELDGLSESIRAIREHAEMLGRRRGKPILIAVRVIDSPEYCRDAGIDLQRWLEQRWVDIVIAGCYLQLREWRRTAEFVHEYGAKFYASMDDSRVPRVATRLIPGRNGQNSFFGRAAAALADGVDGIYYFNLEGESLRNTMFGRLEDLADKTKLYYPVEREGEPTWYLANGRDYYELPPVNPCSGAYPMTVDRGCDFAMVLGDDFTRSGLTATARMLVAGNPRQLYTLQVNGGSLLQAFPDAENICTFPLENTELRQGRNTFSIRLAGQVFPSAWREICTGQEPMLGKTQEPWRRIFPGDPERDERIVDHSLQISDTEEGMADGLLYQLETSKGDCLKMRFELKVIASNTPEAVAVRIADGAFAEVVTFSPDGVGCKFAGISARLNTADAFHTYQLEMREERLIIYADEWKLLEAPLVMEACAPEAVFKTPAEDLQEMNNNSFYFGSLSMEGKGVGQWRHILVADSPAGIRDFQIEVKP